MRKTQPKKSKASKPRVASSVSRVLEGMGVTHAEEQLYRCLLKHEGLCVAELAAKLGSSARAIVEPLRCARRQGHGHAFARSRAALFRDTAGHGGRGADREQPAQRGSAPAQGARGRGRRLDAAAAPRGRRRVSPTSASSRS